MISDTLASKIKGGEGQNLVVYNPTPATEVDDDKKKLSNEILPLSDTKPVWMSVVAYFMLALLGMSWAHRLLIYIKALSANIFMRKVILR